MRRPRLLANAPVSCGGRNETSIAHLGAAQRLKSNRVGQADLLDKLVIALLAGGHVLVEGLPGLAKTTAIKALATATIVHELRHAFARMPNYG